MSHIEHHVDKEYEAMPFSQLVDAPIAALQGISDAKAEQLLAALGVKTIGDLARNKYVLWAQAITHLS